MYIGGGGGAGGNVLSGAMHGFYTTPRRRCHRTRDKEKKFPVGPNFLQRKVYCDSAKDRNRYPTGETSRGGKDG
ncbi:hypothetical protein RUM44_001423 [Polyplax serrata]|uniref:Uncharacterized protein n=1 Tax=Polyplax serrata TaxID=468196 RepID=A0ABR1AK22_POLSC